MRPLRLPLLATLLLTTACFDSRWIQQRQSQAAAVERAKPAELHATPAPGETDLPAAKATRLLKIRVHATPRHAAEVVDWPKQTAQLLEAAGEILGPTLGVRLEIAATATWTARGGEEDLSARLDELAALDDGREVDWVIGLLGSVPRAEMAYHQLGMGRIPGKHLVMRAMNDAREHEAIETNFAFLDVKERSELYRSRKKHKATTVLLHELGHTLGVPHELTVGSIMHPRYDPKAGGFSPAAVGLMAMALSHRRDPAAQTEEAYGQAVLDHLQKTAEVWVAEDRDAVAAAVQASLPRRAPVAPQKPGRPARTLGTDTPMDAADPLAAMAVADRNLYRKALAAKDEGRVREAWEMVKVLLPVYPDSVPVQELRCQIAMAVGGAYEAVQAECKPLMDLTMGAAKKKK